MKAAQGRARTPPSFRFVLQQELAQRCAANAQYSLRAFARRLGVNHATLSQMLRGERPITTRTIEELGAALNLSHDDIRAYCDAEPHVAARGAQAVAELARDAAEILGEWYHFAILELTRVESFRPDVRWVAQVLGLTTDEVAAALSRLLRLRLIDMRGDTWVDLSGDAVAHVDDFPRAAIDRLFDQWRTLAAASLAQGAGAGRSHSATTFAIDSRKLPLAVSAIDRFRTELASMLAGDPPDAVAHLQIHLFPVTQSTEEPL